MSNLVFPLEWEEMFQHIGFPAYFKPYSGGGWKRVYRVTNPQEFFEAYQDSAQNVMTLQEEIDFTEYFRCYAIGRKYGHIMRYDPRQPHANRYVLGAPPIDPAMYQRVHDDCLKLMNALGYDFCTLEFAVRDGIPYAIDFLNVAPDMDYYSVGPVYFEWVVENMARLVIERAQSDFVPGRQYRWDGLLNSAPPALATGRATVPNTFTNTWHPFEVPGRQSGPAPQAKPHDAQPQQGGDEVPEMSTAEGAGA